MKQCYIMDRKKKNFIFFMSLNFLSETKFHTHYSITVFLSDYNWNVFCKCCHLHSLPVSFWWFQRNVIYLSVYLFIVYINSILMCFMTIRNIFYQCTMPWTSLGNLLSIANKYANAYKHRHRHVHNVEHSDE